MLRRSRCHLIERSGLIMLTASILIILASGGTSLLLVLRRVVTEAARAPADAAGCRIVLLGKALRVGEPDEDYLGRLDRALALWRRHRPAEIVILGGKARGTEASEAGRGKVHLVAHGIEAERVRIEESSRHTLENLQRLRDLVPDPGQGVLVSSRYHLARVAEMAKGMGLRFHYVGAEPSWAPDASGRLHALREAFYLHWYLTGRRLARWWAYDGALARIS